QSIRPNTGSESISSSFGLLAREMLLATAYQHPRNKQRRTTRKGVQFARKVGKSTRGKDNRDIVVFRVTSIADAANSPPKRTTQVQNRPATNGAEAGAGLSGRETPRAK